MDIINEFKANGTVHPVSILSDEEVAAARKLLTDHLDAIKWNLNPSTRHKPHLLFPWIQELAKHPKITDTVKQILGEDVLLWYSVIFVKPAKTTEYIPWHQDSTYWAMNKEEGVTAWLAFSDVNVENGCVEYIPGSHKMGEVSHEVETSQDNLLARGQTIKGFSADDTKHIVLKPGQASFHHPSLLHSSAPNLSANPRLGIAFRYIPTSNYPMTLKWLKRSATLVCGSDKYNNFLREPELSSSNAHIGRKLHKRSLRIATIHTLFGDRKRSFFTKLVDAVRTAFSNKGYKMIKYTLLKR